MVEQLAPNAMTTFEATAERLGFDPDTADLALRNNITRIINAASQWIETITGRKFGKAEYTERYVGPGAQELVLRQYPIRSVGYVRDTIDGIDIQPDSYDFTSTGEIGVLYRDEGWMFRGYVGGLSYDYTAPRRYLEVRYTAGYILPKDATPDQPSDLPADLMGIVWAIAEQEYSIIQNGAQGLSAFSISDVSWTFDKEPRDSWLETLGRYTRW